jgi:hypothetical protein
MSTDPVFVILKSTAWLPEDEWETLLGAVVKKYWSPTDNYTPEYPLKYNGGRRFVEKQFNNFVLAIENGVGTAAEVKLKNIGGISWVGHADESFDLRGKHIFYRKLRQHEEFWDRLKEDTEVREKVPQWLGSRWKIKSRVPVCLITGIFFCEDVVFSITEEEEREREANAEVSLGAVLATVANAHGIPAASHGTGNIGAGGSSERHQKKYYKAEDKDASIFALEVKIISSSLFDKDDFKLNDKTPNAPPNRQLGTEHGENLSPASLTILPVNTAQWTDWENEPEKD